MGNHGVPDRKSSAEGLIPFRQKLEAHRSVYLAIAGRLTDFLRRQSLQL